MATMAHFLSAFRAQSRLTRSPSTAPRRRQAFWRLDERTNWLGHRSGASSRRSKRKFRRADEKNDVVALGKFLADFRGHRAGNFSLDHRLCHDSESWRRLLQRVA